MIQYCRYALVPEFRASIGGGTGFWARSAQDLLSLSEWSTDASLPALTAIAPF